MILRLPIFCDCEFRAVRQVRFEVINIATETHIAAFFREVVFHFQPEEIVDKHSHSLDAIP
jgi:hypothetical protein